METNEQGNKGQLRQGDLLFVKLDGMWKAGDSSSGRSKLTPSRDAVIAAGEATGHNHTLVAEDQNLAQLFFSDGGIPVVVVEQGEAQVTHEEHDTQTLEEGTWVVIRQVEYTPDQRWRTVMD